jgi:hypothetical protein
LEEGDLTKTVFISIHDFENKMQAKGTIWLSMLGLYAANDG